MFFLLFSQIQFCNFYFSFYSVFVIFIQMLKVSSVFTVLCLAPFCYILTISGEKCGTETTIDGKIVPFKVYFWSEKNAVSQCLYASGHWTQITKHVTFSFFFTKKKTVSLTLSEHSNRIKWKCLDLQIQKHIIQ